MIKRSLLILAVCAALYSASPAPANAENVQLTKTEAFELHSTLTKLSPGLTPENTMTAADAINILAGDAAAFKSGYLKLMILQNAANQPGATPETLAAFREADAKFAAAADVTKVYDLPLFAITKEEIKASTPPIDANTVATLKRLLKPAAKESLAKQPTPPATTTKG